SPRTGPRHQTQRQQARHPVGASEERTWPQRPLSTSPSTFITMTPEAALEAQVARYRQMTGEERLMIGLRLHELSCEVARDGIRSQHPGITQSDVEEKLKERIHLTYAR